MTDRLLYTMDEAAAQLGICRRTLLAHVRAGDIRFVLFGSFITMVRDFLNLRKD